MGHCILLLSCHDRGISSDDVKHSGNDGSIGTGADYMITLRSLV